MRVFVINAYPERREKYNDKYELFDAVWWEDVSDETMNKYHFRHNAKIPLRKKVCACSLSHKKLLEKIVKEDLKDVFVIEDDIIIDDFERLKELEGFGEFCYIGGDLVPPLLKDMKEFRMNGEKDIVKESLKEGVNTIDTDIFRITQTAGYYVPNAETASYILDKIPKGKKERAIDVEYMNLQKTKYITKFIYPAIATIHIKDAQTGFTQSRYKNIVDNQKYY